MSFPAFKEWHLIVEALGSGEQILILRKGGISEGRGGFQIEAGRFWLFPTSFHQQLEKTKPAAARFASRPSASGNIAANQLELRYFAEITQSTFLTDWTAVSRLDPSHLWTEATVRERFDWSKPTGIHAIIVRVHRLESPLTLRVTPDMSGCKSWIEIPFAFDAQPSSPVLTEAAFTARCSELSL